VRAAEEALESGRALAALERLRAASQRPVLPVEG
jgi:hypothetical protein